MVAAAESATASVPTLPGYTLLERLGEGGMGVVWRARDEATGREVALKQLVRASEGESASRRFRREFRAAARLRHPHVAAVHDIHVEAPLFYTMELVRGRTLDRALAVGPQGITDPARVARIRALTVQILVALDAVHGAELVHRDLKPANLLITELAPEQPLGFEPPEIAQFAYHPGADGGRELVKLLDFGLAWHREQSGGLTQTGMIVGTVDYISPEQVLGSEVDARADLYSLGVMLYELLVGHPPFEAPETVALLLKHAYEKPIAPSQRVAGVDPALEMLAMRLLAKEPADRYPSARAVLRALCGGALEERRRPTLVATRPASRTTGLLPPRLVGRAPDLAAGREALAAARVGKARALLLVGEAGIGKTRLLDELIKDARMQGFVVHAGAAHDEQGYALAPVLPVLDSLARDAASLPLRPDLVEAARVLAPLVPRFAALVGGGGGGRVAASEEERVRVLGAVAEIVRALAEARPLVIALEDLHWSDPFTLDLVAYLERNLGTGVVIAVTIRDEEAEPGSPVARLRESLRRDGALELRLGRLELGELEILARSMLGVSEVPNELVTWLLGESQGVPFLAIEHLSAVAAEGALVPGGAGRLGLKRRLTGEIAFPRALPPTVADLVRRRIDKLPERERKVAGLAAVVGPEVPFDLLHAAAQMDEDELLDAIQLLLRRRVLVESREDPDLFLFPAKVLRQVLAEDLFERRRRRAHERSAGALAARTERRPEDVVALAHHTWLSGNRRSAAHWLVEASALHAGRLDHEEAMVAASRALEAIEAEPAAEPGPGVRAELLLRVGEMATALCIYERAGEALGRTLADSGATAPTRARAELGLAEVALRRGEYADAEAHTARALALVGAAQDQPLVGRAYTSRGRIAWHQGRVEAAGEAFAQALRVARDRGDAGEEQKALHNLGYADFARGDYAEAERHFGEALAGCRTHGNSLGVARALEAMGAVRQRRGGYRLAMSELSEARAAMRKIGDRRGEAYCLVSLGNLDAFRGDWPQAVRLYDEADETFSELGELRGSSFCAANRGRALTALGDYRSALDELGRGLKLARRIDEKGEVVDCLFGLAELFRDAGDFDEAEREDEGVLALAAELGDRYALALALCGAAATALGRGDPERAAVLAGSALLESERARGMPEVEARARITLGRARNDASEAARGAALAEAEGLSELSALGRATEARLLQEQGQPSEAARAKALAVVDALAAPLGQRRDSFLRRLVIREALGM